jgi:stage V sporulation protein SpoVS
MKSETEVRSRQILKLRADSSVRTAALAIANGIRERRVVEVQLLDGRAYNRAARAIATAKDYLASDGIEVMIGSYTDDMDIDGEERRFLAFVIEPRIDVMSRNFVGYLLPRSVRQTRTREFNL